MKTVYLSLPLNVQELVYEDLQIKVINTFKTDEYQGHQDTSEKEEKHGHISLT